jgi:hypothetical protein
LAFPGTGNLAGKKEQGTGVYFSNAKISSKSNRFEEKLTTKAHEGKRSRRLMYPRTVGSSNLWFAAFVVKNSFF